MDAHPQQEGPHDPQPTVDTKKAAKEVLSSTEKGTVVEVKPKEAAPPAAAPETANPTEAVPPEAAHKEAPTKDPEDAAADVPVDDEAETDGGAGAEEDTEVDEMDAQVDAAALNGSDTSTRGAFLKKRLLASGKAGPNKKARAS